MRAGKANPLLFHRDGKSLDCFPLITKSLDWIIGLYSIIVQTITMLSAGKAAP
jgi:hypothetical protein